MDAPPLLMRPDEYRAWLRARQYNPLAFPESGPDRVALRLQAQGAPGAPPRAGTCVVEIVCQIHENGLEPMSYRARGQVCGRSGSVHKVGLLAGEALALAERDAAQLDGHICTR